MHLTRIHLNIGYYTFLFILEPIILKLRTKLLFFPENAKILSQNCCSN